ncbi:hypothetical protein BDZ97DRAFT_1857800 [Flammula alnicola]|nr:hypothetical protein BDZ97DRAFT_1857800 [Flammula alnicola]
MPWVRPLNYPWISCALQFLPRIKATHPDNPINLTTIPFNHNYHHPSAQFLLIKSLPNHSASSSDNSLSSKSAIRLGFLEILPLFMFYFGDHGNCGKKQAP